MEEIKGEVNADVSLRDYFAGQALSESLRMVNSYCEREGYPSDWRNEVASDAYKIADAMLKAREKDMW